MAIAVSRVVSSMQTEFENNTWSLVPSRKRIDCKWVFRVKENVDGSYNKYTTKFAAKRFQQKYNSGKAVKCKSFTTVDDTYKMRDKCDLIQLKKKDENGCSSILYQFNLSHKPR